MQISSSRRYVMSKKIYLSSPTIHGDEQRFVREAFDTNWVAPLGPNVDAFEQEVAAYIGIPHAAALSAGTAAIHLAVRLLNIQPGDIVFCTSMTFAATCNPVTYERGQLVFIDSEKDSWNMSPAALRKAFDKYPKVKAVICADLYGTPAKLDEIEAICQEHDTPLIEDAAEALGSSWKGKMCGSYGRFGTLSFNGNKIITTSGGGMLVSEDGEAIGHARFLATQAREPAPYYLHKELGFNYRMSNLLAGVGRGQMLHLSEHIARKQAIHQYYREALADIDVIEMNPLGGADAVCNHWLSCITLKETSAVRPMDLFTALQKKNIDSRPIWNPMNNQPLYAGCDFIADPEGEENAHGSVCMDIFDRGLCLPSDIKNTEEDMERIVSIIRGLF